MAAVLSLQMIGAAFAQTATTVPAQTTSPTSTVTSEEVVKLSPFVVDASKDEGYRASSTLAGSRINTDLKDLASSVQVVTKEFLNDVGAVDINDVLAFTANTEGTRDYTATVPTLGRPSDGPSQNPQGSIRLRGLFAPNVTRDYFYTLGSAFGANGAAVAGTIGFDSYNLDQVTVNLGPNSVLAGLGSPAGIINYSPQLAGLEQNKNEVSYRFGSFGDKRATFNSNIVAKKNLLAFRVAGVWMDKGYKQQPAWDHDKRIYTALTFQPFEKTTIRASYELAKVAANYPNSLTPEDDVTQWVTLGKPSYDRNSAAPVSSLLYAEGNLPIVVYNPNGAIAGAFNSNTGYYFNQQNLSNVGIWQPIRMSNNNYLQLDKVNTMPSWSHQRLETLSFSVDQEILPNLNANVAFLHEGNDQRSINLFRPEYENYLIDVDVRTAAGTANPNYGQTYMQFRGLDNLQTDHNTNRVARATLTYDLDLTKYNKWFGRYRATGFLENRRTETEHDQYNTKRSDLAFVTVGGGTGAYPESGRRYYLGGTATTPATTVPSQPVLVSNVPSVDLINGAVVNDTLSDFYWMKSINKNLTKMDSNAVVLQGYFWEDRIVGMIGLRRDNVQTTYASVVDPDGVSASTGLLNPVPNYGTFAGHEQQTKTLGAVFHATKWLSFHINKADNFIPVAGQIDLLGNPTPNSKGKGKDYGFSVSLFENKLNAKLNWFENKALNGNAGNPANFPLAQWNMTFMDLQIEPNLARQAGITYKYGVAPGIAVGDPRIAYTADNLAKGLEFELTYNVTKNWRIMGNVSKQESKQTNIAPGLTAFINERLAYWQSIPALWTGLHTINDPWGTNQTGQQHFNQFLLGSQVGYQSVDGQPATQLAKWHGNLVTTYTFDTGPLKGFRFGGGGRYIQKAVIGNPAIYGLVNGAPTVTGLDLAHPFYASGYIGIDVWAGYRTKILNDKYVLDFQLNIRDLQEKGGFRPIAANSDGTHAAFRIVQPRTYYLTTKLEF